MGSLSGILLAIRTSSQSLLSKKAVRAIAFENYHAPSSPISLVLELLKLQDFVDECVNRISPFCFYDFLKFAFKCSPTSYQAGL